MQQYPCFEAVRETQGWFFVFLSNISHFFHQLKKKKNITTGKSRERNNVNKVTVSISTVLAVLENAIQMRINHACKILLRLMSNFWNFHIVTGPLLHFFVHAAPKLIR